MAMWRTVMVLDDVKNFVRTMPNQFRDVPMNIAYLTCLLLLVSDFNVLLHSNKKVWRRWRKGKVCAHHVCLEVEILFISCLSGLLLLTWQHEFLCYFEAFHPFLQSRLRNTSFFFVNNNIIINQSGPSTT